MRELGAIFLPHDTRATTPHSTMASKSNIQAFFAGSILTATLFYLYHRDESASRAVITKKDAKQASRSRNTADNSSQLMDSASLDQRMIRKAEGAIRNRTSRLVIVVERCSNDHNYVSVLLLKVYDSSNATN